MASCNHLNLIQALYDVDPKYKSEIARFFHQTRFPPLGFDGALQIFAKYENQSSIASSSSDTMLEIRSIHIANWIYDLEAYND